MNLDHTHDDRKSAEGELWLEMFAHWLGGVTAGRLADALGITREAAQKAHLGPYREAYGLAYDPSSRTSRIEGDAEALKRAPDSAEDVFALLVSERILAQRGVRPRIHVPVVDLSAPLPYSNPPAFRSMLEAAASRCAIPIEYQAKRRRLAGLFSPHALVRTSGRMHFRGWGAFRDDGGTYVDLVPDRVISVGRPDRAAYVDGTHDVEWSTNCEVRGVVADGVPSGIAEALRREHPDGLSVVTTVANRRYVEASMLGRRVEGYDGPVWKVIGSQRDGSRS